MRWSNEVEWWPSVYMNVRQEITKRLDSLPENLQAQVLQFVEALSSASSGRINGENGKVFRGFSSSLDPLSASKMIQAIDKGCERVEAGEW
jgi:hypothetical protein